MKPPGQVAYEAAAECANPFWLDCVDQHVEWDKLPELSREYWSKVAEAVLAAFAQSVTKTVSSGA